MYDKNFYLCKGYNVQKNEKKPIIFYHIPKCAGTTFSVLFSYLFSPELFNDRDFTFIDLLHAITANDIYLMNICHHSAKCRWLQRSGMIGPPQRAINSDMPLYNTRPKHGRGIGRDKGRLVTGITYGNRIFVFESLDGFQI